MVRREDRDEVPGGAFVVLVAVGQMGDTMLDLAAGVEDAIQLARQEAVVAGGTPRRIGSRRATGSKAVAARSRRRRPGRRKQRATPMPDARRQRLPRS
ncbi:MAG: hypothetical protein M3Q71_15495 [Chloroflexota bacterium]|nr:hypothetical protein [Chloroflexota bacterium]